MYTVQALDYGVVRSLKLGYPAEKPVLPQKTYRDRLEKLLWAMEGRGLDAFVLYADREHAANFLYLTGVDPRFEEALLVMHRDGRLFGVFGNECLCLAENARIPMEGVLCQSMSLPDQPMEHFISMEHTLRACALREGMKLGVADWKLFHRAHGPAYRALSAMPAYILDALLRIAGDNYENATDLLIGEQGIRLKADAATIAEMEYGAACASQSVLDMMDALTPGMSEMELANYIQSFGQPLSCHPYVVAGKNTRRGLISPSNYRISLGDDCVLCVGLQGGLTCRHGVVAYGSEDLPFDGEHYMENIIKPYMATVFNWYEKIGLGVSCGELYDMVASQYPANVYGWNLNPGHTIGYEEWMSSPIYEGSTLKIQSGMVFQMDIIPSDPQYPTPNAEDGVAIADEALREELRENYPAVYARIMARRSYAQEEIGLKLKPELLPLANSFALFRPYLLSREKAILLRR